ncbi:hypothetical protein BASA61_007065 [Batrachochytrium salamandrivorans]|nr:hypothetical protein BASA61_007065 [Batrachochytrium salamandrivorans]
MGCGASKLPADATVRTTIAEEPSAKVVEAASNSTSTTAGILKKTVVTPYPESNNTAVVSGTPDVHSTPLLLSSRVHASPVTTADTVPLSRPVIPSIPSDTIKAVTISAAVAFEIPLDELDKAPRKSLKNPEESSQVSTKLFLPKLHLSSKDLQGKLADTEARWKVRDGLDRLLGVDLDQECDTRRRRRGDMPQLVNRKEADPEALKRRMREREIAATLNRQREIEKLQAKLARQEQHIRRVQERKKAMGSGSNEELRLSWGGEKGLGAVNDGSDQDLSTAKSMSDQAAVFGGDSRSGSNLSCTTSGKLAYGVSTTRSGSGRSTMTDTTDVGEDSSLNQPSVVTLMKNSKDISNSLDGNDGSQLIMPL